MHDFNCNVSVLLLPASDLSKDLNTDLFSLRVQCKCMEIVRISAAAFSSACASSFFLPWNPGLSKIFLSLYCTVFEQRSQREPGLKAHLFSLSFSNRYYACCRAEEYKSCSGEPRFDAIALNKLCSMQWDLFSSPWRCFHSYSKKNWIVLRREFRSVIFSYVHTRRPSTEAHLRRGQKR